MIPPPVDAINSASPRGPTPQMALTIPVRLRERANERVTPFFIRHTEYGAQWPANPEGTQMVGVAQVQDVEEEQEDDCIS